MKDYYQILGVSKTAQASDIKRAYRRLVQQLHPDVNPDPEAQGLIREINEAYDILGDENKRSEYDYRLENPFSTIIVDQTPPHRDPAYRRRAYRPPKPGGPTRHELLANALRYLKPVTWAGCLLCLALCTDFVVPQTETVETIENFRVETFRWSHREYLVTDTGRELKVSDLDFQKLSVGQRLVFTESKLFSIMIKIQSEDGTLKITNLATLYSNFLFVPVMLLIFSALGLVSIGSVEFRFNVGIVNAFLLIFTLILIFK